MHCAEGACNTLKEGCTKCETDYEVKADSTGLCVAKNILHSVVERLDAKPQALLLKGVLDLPEQQVVINKIKSLAKVEKQEDQMHGELPEGFLARA